jgi:serine/threonine protein kinase
MDNNLARYSSNASSNSPESASSPSNSTRVFSPTTIPKTQAILSPTSGTAGESLRRRGPADFEMGEVIGDGSYSTVIYAKEKSPPFREFAIKILDKKHIIKHKKVAYVNVEKHVLSVLNGHPSVIRLYFTFQDEQSLYFVLSLCKNGDLLDLIRSNEGLTLEATKYYGAQLVEAIEFIHSRNVIHRDLKPENVLLDADFHIKLADFGTSKLLDSNAPASLEPPEVAPGKRSHSFVGTAEYVPPELLNDTPASLYAMDIWALGCMLYQMMANKPPFKGGNEYQTFQKIIKRDFDFKPGFDPLLKDLVMRLLEADVSRRLGCASVMKADFTTIKSHPFFAGTQWGSLWSIPAPLSTLARRPTKRSDVQEGDVASQLSELDKLLKDMEAISPFSGVYPSPTGPLTMPEPSPFMEATASLGNVIPPTPGSDSSSISEKPLEIRTASPRASGGLRAGSVTARDSKSPSPTNPTKAKAKPLMRLDLSNGPAPVRNSSPVGTPFAKTPRNTPGQVTPLSSAALPKPGYFDIPISDSPGGLMPGVVPGMMYGPNGEVSFSNLPVTPGMGGPLPPPGFYTGWMSPAGTPVDRIPPGMSNPSSGMSVTGSISGSSLGDPREWKMPPPMSAPASSSSVVSLGDFASPLAPPSKSFPEKSRSEELKQMALLEQRRPGNPLNRFTPHLSKAEVVVAYGMVKDKRTINLLLQSKSRMLVLTDTPRLLYMDEKGIICKEVFKLDKSFGFRVMDAKTFVMKTGEGVIYEFEEGTGHAQSWVDKMKASVGKREREREVAGLERAYRTPSERT